MAKVGLVVEPSGQGACVPPRAAPSADALAIGLVALLMASIRNAWDMVIFYATRSNGAGSSGSN